MNKISYIAMDARGDAHLLSGVGEALAVSSSCNSAASVVTTSDAALFAYAAEPAIAQRRGRANEHRDVTVARLPAWRKLVVLVSSGYA